MDKIIISGLNLRAIIGTLPGERIEKQTLRINAELSGDFRKAGRSDHFMDTFDYSAVERDIVEFVENSSYQLLEALAEHLAERCLNHHPLIQAVTLRIDKPGAPRFAECIGIEITRTRGE